MAENYFIEDCERLESLAPITGAPSATALSSSAAVCPGRAVA